MALHSAVKGKLISVIGDEDTCVGFLLGGVGEINKNRHPNFMVVDKNTAVSEIEDCFKRFIRRDDIDIILINQNVAELIRHVIDGHTQPVPAVLEIPSKDHPYDASKDSILRRARACSIRTIWSVERRQFLLFSNKHTFLCIDCWTPHHVAIKLFSGIVAGLLITTLGFRSVSLQKVIKKGTTPGYIVIQMCPKFWPRSLSKQKKM